VRPYSKNKAKMSWGGVAQVVEGLPSKHKAKFNPSIGKKILTQTPNFPVCQIKLIGLHFGTEEC
jgi:hypothetical protein